MSDRISLEREYNVVAATGLQEPMIGDLAYDTARDCLWTTLQEYKNHKPRLLRLDLASGDIKVIDLPTERFVGGLTVGKDGCLLVGDMNGERPHLLVLDDSGDVVRSVSTGRGWPSHIWETASGDLVMAGGSRRGLSGVCCYSRGGRKRWQADLPPSTHGVIPVHQGGRTFAAAQSSRISALEIDGSGAFVGCKDIGPANTRPSLMVATGSSSKHLGWSNSLLDATAGPDPSSLLILYGFPLHFRELYCGSGTKLLLLNYRWGHMPLAFEPPSRIQKVTAVGPNRIAGFRQIIPRNECVISTFLIDDWGAGVPLLQIADASGEADGPSDM